MRYTLDGMLCLFVDDDAVMTLWNQNPHELGWQPGELHGFMISAHSNPCWIMEVEAPASLEEP